ncbi:LLM class flavin-dependent oxidoreductase [Streptomyces erythrochromogenes]|uniref:LLM class flavin-dependent oxidoreductase n=1 Tax=Streptomyces erythrochromogenes TaxID=285574 RepID=UPI0033319CFB
MTNPRLSVLDQTPVGEDHTADQALRASVDLARAAEDLGYTRYWVAEHHGSPGFASSAPEILAGALLARTSRMRIGTGGVLLPRYDPAKVAEVFGVLASLHPGRVDLGIGRAGGPARDFPQRLADLRTLLGAGGVVPHPPVPPQMWLLGAGRESARLAGLLGTDFAFGHFFSPAGGPEAFDDYRSQFRRTTGRPAGGALAVRVVTADSAGRAEELAQSLLLWRARKDLGQDAPLPSYETTRRHRWTGAELERAKVHRAALVSGAPEQVHAVLTGLVATHGVDELIVNTLTADPSDRRRSYELLAEAFDLPAHRTEVPVPAAR